MTLTIPSWITVRRGDAPLVLSFPHTGTDLPSPVDSHVISRWLALRDTDWWIEKLYAFAENLDATMIRTTVSRTVIDLNRDPSGASLYPGMATTDLCSPITFDGDPIYKTGMAPDSAEIKRRRIAYFEPYHAVLRAEVDRLRGAHANVVLYDCHSIRSVIPRLFDGELPIFNIGTNKGASCAPELAGAINQICAASGQSHVLNGRFTGGYITRLYGQPAIGVHAVQMELSCRGYMDDPPAISEKNWPTPYVEAEASASAATLRRVLQACLSFASKSA
jgi:N-formylglutamate deformylase